MSSLGRCDGYSRIIFEGRAAMVLSLILRSRAAASRRMRPVSGPHGSRRAKMRSSP